MQKTIIKCYFRDREISKIEYLTEYDKKHNRNGYTRKYNRYILIERKGYSLTPNLAVYKLNGKGTPCIIDLQTGLSIGTFDLKVWGKHAKTFKELETYNMEAMEDYLNKHIRNTKLYQQLKDNFNKLLKSEVTEILERIDGIRLTKKNS